MTALPSPAKKTSKNKRSHVKEYKTLKLLSQQFPKAFNFKKVKPLKVGIFADLKEILNSMPEAPLSIRDCKKAITFYTRSPHYQKALSAPGAMRINLQGKPVSEVDPSHAAYAKVKYGWWLKRQEGKSDYNKKGTN